MSKCLGQSNPVAERVLRRRFLKLPHRCRVLCRGHSGVSSSLGAAIWARWRRRSLDIRGVPVRRDIYPRPFPRRAGSPVSRSRGRVARPRSWCTVSAGARCRGCSIPCSARWRPCLGLTLAASTLGVWRQGRGRLRLCLCPL